MAGHVPRRCLLVLLLTAFLLVACGEEASVDPVVGTWRWKSPLQILDDATMVDFEYEEGQTLVLLPDGRCDIAGGFAGWAVQVGTEEAKADTIEHNKVPEGGRGPEDDLLDIDPSTFAPPELSWRRDGDHVRIWASTRDANREVMTVRIVEPNLLASHEPLGRGTHACLWERAPE